MPGPTIEVDAEPCDGGAPDQRPFRRGYPILGYKPYTSTHLHGSPSLPQYDGYANDITNPGEFKDYHYPNTHEGEHALVPRPRRAHHGTERLHGARGVLPHPRRRASVNCRLPRGRYDVPLMVKDAIFANSGVHLLFDDNSESNLYGDVVLVNGKPWPVMQVERRKYRFRILNASVSRSYEWATRHPASR